MGDLTKSLLEYASPLGRQMIRREEERFQAEKRQVLGPLEACLATSPPKDAFGWLGAMETELLSLPLEFSTNYQYPGGLYRQFFLIRGHRMGIFVPGFETPALADDHEAYLKEGNVWISVSGVHTVDSQALGMYRGRIEQLPQEQWVDFMHNNEAGLLDLSWDVTRNIEHDLGILRHYFTIQGVELCLFVWGATRAGKKCVPPGDKTYKKQGKVWIGGE